MLISMMELVVQILLIVMTLFCNDISVSYIVVIGLVTLTALTSACVHNNNNKNNNHYFFYWQFSPVRVCPDHNQENRVESCSWDTGNFRQPAKNCQSTILWSCTNVLYFVLESLLRCEIGHEFHETEFQQHFSHSSGTNVTSVKREKS